MNEAPISPPDLEAQAGSGRTVVGHTVLSKAYALETYRPRRLATSARGICISWARESSARGWKVRNSSNARLTEWFMQRQLSLDLIYLFNHRQTERIRRKINNRQRLLVPEFIQRVLRVLFDNIRKSPFLSALLTKMSTSCVNRWKRMILL